MLEWLLSKRQGCEEEGMAVDYWWKCKLVQPLWKTVWRVLNKLKIELPYDSVIPLLSIYPKKMKKTNLIDICTPMSIAPLFTTVNI